MKSVGISEESICQEIRRDIKTQVIIPGQRLVEAKLAERFGVSRTPIRNVLRRLSYDGLVKIVANVGAVVVEPSTKEIEDVFQIRLELEGLSARLAASRLSEDQLARLDSLRRSEMEACHTSDFEGYMNANDGIHVLLCEASGNGVLLSVLMPLLARSDSYLVFLDELPADEFRSIGEHGDLADALRARDPSRAEKCMRTHLLSTLEHLNLRSLRLREQLALRRGSVNPRHPEEGTR